MDPRGGQHPIPGAVMIDTVDPAPLVAFWTALLGTEVAYQSDDFVWLRRNAPDVLGLAFQKVPEAKGGKNRVHVDFVAPDIDQVRARVEELGGSLLFDRSHEDFRWLVLADPEGNEFCVSAEEDEDAGTA
ncbi:MAG: VOC family protein [Chloroflexi bacterium]|nr:VOC family protein [Chloroflexota bacterium]